MNHEEEINTAWTLWHLMARLNELIWHQYENEFIQRYFKLEKEKYREEKAEKDLEAEPQ